MWLIFRLHPNACLKSDPAKTVAAVVAGTPLNHLPSCSPVNDCFVLLQSEDPRAGIARLGFRDHAAHLHESKPKAQHCFVGFAMLVISSSQS